MERTGQGNKGQFEGGIFSGGEKGREDNGYREYGYYGNVSNHDKKVYPDSCFRCQACPYNKKTDHTALILAVIVAVVIVLIAFLATMLCLISFVFMLQNPKEKEVKGFPYNNYTYEQEAEVGEIGEAAKPPQTIPAAPFEEWGGDTPSKEAASSGEYYGELKDAVRQDLEYSIEWENYEYEGNNENVMIIVDYPVIKGDIPNKDVINEEIKSETEYFQEYYEEYSKYMLPEESFGVYSEGYVTYMDEEMMSVVFCETIYTDYGVDCGLFCINIDVENGVILNNSSILKVDEAFVADFRSRSREQNGEVSELNYMTDVQLADYLSAPGTSILFYTPKGMEVGVNYGIDYVTVTYTDYEKFLLKY